jgi:hypothetical protein
MLLLEDALQTIIAAATSLLMLSLLLLTCCVQVMKDGRLQRFCQQCGRFHDLSAFDGNRKSCREQLQKHNARRRRR